MLLPTRATVCSKEIFSSCSPAAALVEGVNRVSGNLPAKGISAGNEMPHTDCLDWYSFQPDPINYPRTIASMGNAFRRLTTTERPSACSISSLLRFKSDNVMELT